MVSKQRPEARLSKNMKKVLGEEIGLAKIRIELRREYVDKDEKQNKTEFTEVKLPKAVISKFEFRTLDCFHNWNQF